MIADLLNRILNDGHVWAWGPILAGGAMLERALPAARVIPPTEDTTRVNLLNGVFLTVISILAMPLALTAAGKVAALIDMKGIKIDIATSFPLLDFAITALIFCFIYDLLFYFWHRAEHKFAPLWHIHAVHHSDRHFNITTYARQHWLEMFCQTFMITLPIGLLFDFNQLDSFSVGLIMVGWTFFTHMNIRGSMRPLHWLICGPQNHRIHHSVLPAHTDRNFAQFFPFIDMVFGTYCPVAHDEYPPTGLHTGEPVDHPRDMLFWPFLKYGQSMRKRRERSQ